MTTAADISIPLRWLKRIEIETTRRDQLNWRFSQVKSSPSPNPSRSTGTGTQHIAMASELDAVCRSEASRVVFALRGNRRFGSRSWRDLEETSPLRQLCSWRLNGDGPNELLEPLLRVIRSPDFAGPATFVALEATQNVIVAICEEQRSQTPEALRHLATTLVDVCRAACDCVFEETNAQTDEATAAQMIALIGLCCSAAPWDVSSGSVPIGFQNQGPDAVLIFSPQDRVKAFSKVLQFWSHYRESHTLRASAQATLQRMLDLTLVDLMSPARYEFLRVTLGTMAAEAEPGMPMERALLYLRCLQRLAMHSTSRRWAMSEQGRFFQNDIPLLLLSFCKLFPGSLPLLTLLLPVVNRICWLCVDFWAEKAGVMGLRAAAMGKSSSKWRAPLSDKEVAALADGLSLAGAPLQPPKLLQMGWKEGQVFSASDDPDRTELPWQGPSFLERKDPKLQRGKTQWEELVIPGGPDRFAGVVTGVFDEDDCAELIECINHKGFTPALLNIGHGRQMLDLQARDGHRAIVDSPELSGYLLEVLRPYLPETFQRGTLIDLNERCRVLCYTPGQEFPAHYDGTFRRPRPDPRAGDRSMITVQVYLHDVPEGSGGGTTFMKDSEEVVCRCQPRAGSVLIFSQNLLHEAASSSAALGALQVDALLSGVYIRSLDYAVAPLITEASAAPVTPEEAVHLVELLLESLYDLLQPSLVQALWFSFDGDWRRPPLLEQVAGKAAELVTKRPPSSERPLPAHLMQLCSAVLTRIVSAFVDVSAEGGKSAADELERLQKQWQLRSDLRELMLKIEESPKKARGAFEKSSLVEVVPLPPGSSCEVSEEWVFKLIWLFRTVHFLVPYSAVGEFFGQPKEDSEKAVTTFSESFDWGAADIEKALRSFLEAFLLPKEAQQIDRILRVFAHAYYHKHVEHCRSSGKEGAGYLKHPDAAYTFAFSVILLNSDQHNPKLKKRMSVKDFISNNRGINEGEDIPQEVQVQVFESIRQDEIKTPSSGSFIEGISRTRWEDFLNLTRKGWRDNSLTTQTNNLTGQAAGFLQRFSQTFRDVLEYSLACEGGAESFAAAGLEQLLRLALQLQQPEADRAAESLFFFASEVFHEAESEMVLARGASCLRALVRTAHTSAPPSWSTKHIHLLVYLTVQFAVYGVFEKVLPAIDAATRKLLLCPVLVVDPPTGVVYNFLRKISTAPFKMLSFAEDGAAPGGQGSAVRSASAPVHAEEESSSPPPPPPRLKSAGALRSGIQEVQVKEVPEADAETETATSEDSNEAVQNMPEEPDSEGFLQKDPMKPQIQRLFEASDLDHFLKVMLDPWLQVSRTPTPSPRIKATCGGGDAGAGSGRLSDDGGPARVTEVTSASSSIQLFLCYLSSLFLALRSGARLAPGKEDLPFWPQDASSLGIPQALQLPKRTLQLNVLDSYDTLRLATRLLLMTVGHAKCVPWEAPAMQELSVCAHVGILYTLRRKDLNERTLKFSIVAIFQIASSLLTLEDAGISSGWPVRLIEALVNRTEAEPHLLVPHCKLLVEAVRSFIQASSGRLESPELWRAIFQLLLRCVPTSQRALWPGAKDKEVESLQLYLWQYGLVWILSHPELRDSNEAEGKPNDADANNFWGWAISEMTTLAQEMAGQRGTGSIRLLLYAYRMILQSVAQPNGDDASPREEVSTGEESPGESFSGAGEPTPDRAAKGAAWSRVAIGMLNFVGPAIGRPMDEPDLLVLPLLKQSLLHARVPSLLAAGAHGPFWARSVLEKLVSVLTGPITSQTPLKVVREAVTLVSKFFLQNLQTLQRHDCFGQLWLMVLRLMLQFIKRGSDDHDAELEEVATETLRNLLGVLVSTNILGFVSKAADSTPPVWWQMTWDCIEVFIPGFGEDFSKSLLGSSPAAREAWEHFIFVPLPQSRVKTSIVPKVQHRRVDESSGTALQDAVMALGLAGAGAMGTMLAPSAAFMKLAMMVPPPPSLPPAAPPLSAATAIATATPQQFSLLDTLLPNFNTDTFIWRVSMLQITEYVGSLLLGSAYGSPKLCSLYLLGASWGPAIAQGAVWRLMLPMMLHANALHIFFNLFFQMRIGFGMEKQFGRRKFCLLYMFCGFLGNLISVAVDPMKPAGGLGGKGLAVGASTSGFGLLGVWAAEVLLTWDLLGESRSRIFLWFAFMCTSCIMMSTISPNVDFVGHFAGMLAGFLLAIILADMQEEHQPPWYNKAKLTAKNVTALIVILSLVRAITLGPESWQSLPVTATRFAASHRKACGPTGCWRNVKRCGRCRSAAAVVPGGQTW
eukprot:s9_g21.t1